MALGKASKILIFVICVSTITAFVANSGVYLGNDENIQTMSEKIHQLHNQSVSTVNEGGSGGSGFSVTDVFNPMNYKIVADGIAILTSFMFDPYIMFGTLPAPFNNLFGIMFAVLQIFAVVGIVRGVTV